MQYQMMELEIARFRERKTEEKDAELAVRLAVLKSTEEMFRAIRALQGLNVKEREAALAAG